MKPVYVEVITKVLTTYDHCRRCEVIFDQVGINRKLHNRDINEYPQGTKEEFLRLSDWIIRFTRIGSPRKENSQ